MFLNHAKKNGRLWRDFRIFFSVHQPSPSECPPPLTVASYLEEHLAESDRDAFELHLSQCETCFTQVRDLRMILSPRVSDPLSSVRGEKEQPLALSFRLEKKLALVAAMLLVSFFGYMTGFATIRTPRNREAYVVGQKDLLLVSGPYFRFASDFGRNTVK